MPETHRMLERALDILELAGQYENGLSLSEICNMLDMPKSSVHSLVHTLCKRKYLAYDKERQKYSIGVKTFEMGSRFLSSSGLRKEIIDAINKLAEECGETVHFGILDDGDVIYLHKCESKQQIRMASSVGKRLPAYSTAIGKALLSGLKDEEIKKLYPQNNFKKLTVNTINDINILLKQINEARLSGFAYEIEESTEGIRCVSAPIKNADNIVVAAISIAVPVYRANQEFINKLAAMVMDYAAVLSKLIGNRGLSVKDVFS